MTCRNGRNAICQLFGEEESMKRSARLGAFQKNIFCNSKKNCNNNEKWNDKNNLPKNNRQKIV